MNNAFKILCISLGFFSFTQALGSLLPSELIVISFYGLDISFKIEAENIQNQP